MNDLMTLLRVSSFELLLFAYEKTNGGKLDFDVIDGGAEVGQTSRQMQNTCHRLEQYLHLNHTPATISYLNTKKVK